MSTYAIHGESETRNGFPPKTHFGSKSLSTVREYLSTLYLGKLTTAQKMSDISIGSAKSSDFFVPPVNKDPLVVLLFVAYDLIQSIPRFGL